MSSKLLNSEGSSEASFRLESMRRVPPKDSVKSFVITLLLLVVSFLTFVAAMLLLFHFFIPFFLLLQRKVKRRLRTLAMVSAAVASRSSAPTSRSA